MTKILRRVKIMTFVLKNFKISNLSFFTIVLQCMTNLHDYRITYTVSFDCNDLAIHTNLEYSIFFTILSSNQC